MSYLWHGTWGLQCCIVFISAAAHAADSAPLLAAGPISCPAQLIMSARDHESESDHGNALRFDNFIQEQTWNKIFQEKQLTII